ncbi:hypothetical protein N7510_004269 [Penicillium lagena]|uniref:uncharacterized protein n=1 Tax=Penicillium lagena TaxID=94218 RepID=UPI00253F8881|nr:uncharacterized protein N7510_004269 [Penicillium lagena]KAJ5620285.1 hypothetical protein N7510_004269 [Penicillium lagena]
MAATKSNSAIETLEKPLSKWRFNSFRSGGKRPELVPIVNKANVLLYSLFGASGVLGGSVINKIGPRYALMIGATGYPVYAGSLWWIDKGEGTWFTLFGGAWLGCSAGLLWSTQGYITTCYPTESKKGKYIAITWTLNAIGSLVGAAVVLGVTINNTSTSGVPSSVYLTFICLEVFGLLIAGFLMDPAKLRRDDGQPIASFEPLPWYQELKMLGKTLVEPKMTLITLGIFSSEMYLSMASSFNSWYFDARTRALANLGYWVFQILGSLAVAFVCDSRIFGSRRQRAFFALGLVGIVIGGTWIAMLSFLGTHKINRHDPPPGNDWSNAAFGGPFVIYMFLGACYPIYQNFHQWAYSTFSNEPHVLGRYSGYFKGVQAWGTAVAFGIDSHEVPFIHEAAAYCSLMMAGLALTAVSIYRNTLNTRYGMEEGVAIPKESRDFIPGYALEDSTDPNSVTIGVEGKTSQHDSDKASTAA